MRDKRKNQISEEVKRTISEIVQRELKDPRIPSLTVISNVDVTRDLSYAKVYVSVLGSDGDRDDAIEGLNSAKGFIKREISKRLKLRIMPELIFINDKSIEKGIEMSKLIDEVNNE